MFYKEIVETSSSIGRARKMIREAAAHGHHDVFVVTNGTAAELLEQEGFTVVQTSPVGKDGSFTASVTWE